MQHENLFIRQEQQTFHDVLGARLHLIFIHLSRAKLFPSSRLLKWWNFIFLVISQKCSFFFSRFEWTLTISFVWNLVHDWDPENWWNAIICSAKAGDNFMNESRAESCAGRSLRWRCAHDPRETSNDRMHFWIPRQCLFYVFRIFFLCSSTLVMYWF